MEFTTEQRREMTGSVIVQNDFVNNSVQFSDNINASYGGAVKEDKTNREIFLSLNSELTGLAYEYKYITGKCHPMLEETIFEYKEIKDNDFIDGTFLDSQKLHDAASLLEDNEFHLNLSEGSTVYYPEHPVKYSHWVSDSHEEVSTTYPTEQDIFTTIRTVLGWYNSGGLSGLAQDLTIYNSFKFYIDSLPYNKQSFMTVGFQEYTVGSSPYMSDGYDPIDDIIYINKQDNNNFCLAKIMDAKVQPARILIAPFFIKGIIPDNSTITSQHDQFDNKYIILAHELINKLEEIYNNILTYLTHNPNKNVSMNIITMANINASLLLIKTLRDGDMFNIGRLLGFVNDIEALRIPIWNDRIEFIKNSLSSRVKLYEDRFKIIDMRLSKRMGTLREMMKLKDGITEIFRISDEKKGQVDWFKKYFVIRRCERNGDWKRRVFIKDDTNDFKEGDEVYLLSDNANIPEIKAIIDVIVLARLEDQAKTRLDDATGELVKEYYPVKKLFFKEAWLNGTMKPVRFFSEEYKSLEGFRVIKQIITIELESIVNIIITGSSSPVLNFITYTTGKFVITGSSINNNILNFIINFGVITIAGSIGQVVLGSINIPQGIFNFGGSSINYVVFVFDIDSEKIVISGSVNNIALSYIYVPSGIIYTSGSSSTDTIKHFIYDTSGVVSITGDFQVVVILL